MLSSSVQILCKRVKLWLSRGKISTLRLPQFQEEVVQEDDQFDSIRFPIGSLGNCAVTAARPTDYFQRANSRIQSCKYENSGCWGKMHFAYVQWMRNHASMRRNRVSNLYLVDAPVLVDQVVEKFAISFDFSANISNSGCSN